MIYLLLRAFWCWWFWQHALGPCTAWHNVARLRKPPWRNRQRAKYTIERDVEPKKTVQNRLKGTLVFSICIPCKQMFYIWATCKEEQLLCPSTSSNQKWIQQQVFVWCTNIHDIHMGTKCRTHSVFQKAHWVYFQKDLRYENHLRVETVMIMVWCHSLPAKFSTPCYSYTTPSACLKQPLRIRDFPALTDRLKWPWKHPCDDNMW